MRYSVEFYFASFTGAIVRFALGTDSSDTAHEWIETWESAHVNYPYAWGYSYTVG